MKSLYPLRLILSAFPPQTHPPTHAHRNYLDKCYTTSREDERFLIKQPSASNPPPQQMDDIELPQSVLEVNLGVPVILVGLKSDMVKSDTYEEEQKAQYVQQYLRRVCLKYGAALAYVSAQTDSNKTLLQQYILHRLVGVLVSVVVLVVAMKNTNNWK